MLRALPAAQRPRVMASDPRWQMACWIHQRPVASVLAWTVPGALLGAFFGWGLMVGLDGGGQPVDWLLVVIPALLFLLVGLANWATGRSCAAGALRRLGG